MQLLPFFGILAGVLSVICYLPYIRDIFKGTSKPERASWMIWSVLGSIAFFSQLAEGASNSLWLTGVQTFGVLAIFLLSLKYGYGSFSRRDVISLILAAIGLIIWYFTKTAAYALYIVIIVDALGAWLTIVKSYEDPASETLIMWVLAGFSGLAATIAVGSLNITLLSYPIYICLINLLTAGAILLGRNRIKYISTK